MSNKGRKWPRILRVILRILAVFIVLVISVILILNIPSVQTYIAQKFVSSIRSKTGTEISIKSIKISIPTKVELAELFVRDQRKDTLLYLKSLSADIDIFELLKNRVIINRVEFDNLVAHISRKETEENFNFQFILDAFSPEVADTSKAPDSWFMKFDAIELKKINLSYSDFKSGFDVKVSLGDMKTTIKDFDLTKNLIQIDEFYLANSDLKVSTKKPKNEGSSILSANDSVLIADREFRTTVIADLFPEWEIAVKSFSIAKTNLKYDDEDFAKIKNVFDSRHIDLQRLNTRITEFQISPMGLNANIDTLDFIESCGFHLESLSVQARFNERLAELKKLQIKSSRSNLSGDAQMSYSTFNDLLTKPQESHVVLDVRKADLDVSDAKLFAVLPADNDLIKKFGDGVISLEAKAGGKIGDLEVQNIELSLPGSTFFKAHGNFKGLPDINKLWINTNIDLCSTSKSDLLKFAGPETFTGLNLPESIVLKGSIKGKVDSLSSEMQLDTDFGKVHLSAFYQKQKQAKDSVNIEFNANDILAGRILKDTLYGKVNLSGEASISRVNDSLFYGTASLAIADAVFNSYRYKDIQINSEMNGNSHNLKINSADSSMTFDLNAEIDLQNKRKRISVISDITGLNLNKLNFSEKEFSLSTNLKAELEFESLNNAQCSLLLSNTTLYNDRKTMPVKNIDINLTSASSGVGLNLHSDVIDGWVRSNITADSLPETILTSFKKYLGTDGEKVIQPGKNISFEVNVHAPNDIINLFDSKLSELNINKFDGNYSSDNNDLSIVLGLPRLNYAGVVFDSLKMKLNGTGTKLNLDLICEKAVYNNFYAKKLRISEELDHGSFKSEISVNDSSDAHRYYFANKLEIGEDNFSISFLPEGLILDGQSWNVEPDNYFEYRTGGKDRNHSVYNSKNFIFSNKEKSFGIFSEGRNQILKFEKFLIQDLISVVSFQNKSEMFESGAKFVKGELNGEIVFPFFPGVKDINANLDITDLHILDSLIGNLSLNISAVNGILNIQSGLVNKEDKILLNGTIAQNPQSIVLDLNSKIDINNLGNFERFTFGSLSEMSGKFIGEIDISGNLEQPEILGELNFKDAALKVNSLNFYAKLNNDKILLSNKGVHFENFIVEDIHSKKLKIEGDVLTNNFKKVEFDLKFSAKEFQPINSTKDDNPMFYGKLSMGADVQLTGDLKSPVVDASIQIDSITNLTYALPGSELKLVTSEGIVEFLDSANVIDTTLMVKDAEYVTDSIMSRIKGLNLKARIFLDKGVQFTIDVDPKSGDYLTVKGGAKLDIVSNANGEKTINGVYEVTSGTYQLSFYDLVKKDFTIKPGSTIAWSGRPMDGDMNITAEYVVRTTSVALVANESTSMSEEEKKLFNRRLPYEVKLNIRGLISRPEISFNISLPPQYLSDNQLVEAKLRQLNSPDMADQLNKQVFGLLVAGAFIADSPMDNTNSSSNLASTAARNSVNGILASQLNNVSGRYITGVDVNFGITSYEDNSGGSGDMRTEMDIQVSKKLFNDRITVEAENSFGINGSKKDNTGSTTTQGYGQFAVIYSLTESGEYKLRAYYQNAYDPFDGDISYSGIAVIFEKELDSLWPKNSRAAGQTNEITK